MPFSFLGAKHLVSFLSSCLFDLCPYCAFSCGGIPEDTSWYKIARYRQRAFFSVSFVRIGDSWVIQLSNCPYHIATRLYQHQHHVMTATYLSHLHPQRHTSTSSHILSTGSRHSKTCGTPLSCSKSLHLIATDHHSQGPRGATDFQALSSILIIQFLFLGLGNGHT